MTALALDIGGANLKISNGVDYHESVYFPLWKKPAELPAALRELLAAAPRAERLVATMTGELADCYRTKREGVEHIIESLITAAEQPVEIYLTDGTFATPAAARAMPHQAAASNWHALARFAGRFAPQGTGLLLDIGSTTSDFVPLRAGRPTPRGFTDPERLAQSELVYTGVERSPLCAVINRLPWRQTTCPTAHELFATTWDAYLLLGELPPEPDTRHTADARPATPEFAHERLARAICADRELFDWEDAQRAAQAVEQAQLALLESAAQQVFAALGSAPETVVISGRGEFLARKLIARLSSVPSVVSLTAELGPQANCAATAYALAVLAREE